MIFSALGTQLTYCWTGAPLQGSISVGEMLEIPGLKVMNKVRSIQMFKRPINKVRQFE